MAANFLPLTVTPAVLAAQTRAYGKAHPSDPQRGADTLGEDEAAFIRDRDSFYLSTINENGWPYIQHRGGPKGFLKVLDARTLGFADLRGNRQLLTTGNLAANNRVALFLIDYPRRERLKILGHARTFLAADEPALAARIAEPSSRPAHGPLIERFVVIEVVAFDWNCPQHITPRYTVDEISVATQPLRDRIAELETLLAKQNR